MWQIFQHVDAKIKIDKHSVDAICGRAKLMNTFEPSKRLCSETIYR